MSSAEVAKQFNFNKAVFPGIQGGPLMHVIAAKAVCFKEALQPEYKEYQKNIVKNAKALCNGLLKRGIQIVSGTTENHLMLVDLRGIGITGKEMEHLLDEANITCNKNAIPNGIPICHQWRPPGNSSSNLQRHERRRYGRNRRSHCPYGKEPRKQRKSHGNCEKTYR